MKTLTSLIFLFVTLNISILLADEEDAESFQCREDIASILDEVNHGTLSIEICSSKKYDASIYLTDYWISGDKSERQGGFIRLLSLRLENHQTDRTPRPVISISPRTKEIWDVLFFDPREPKSIISSLGGFRWTIWSRSQSNTIEFLSDQEVLSTAGPVDDISLRVFRCSLDVTLGCSTTYDVPMCANYRYPHFEKREPRTTDPTNPLIAVVSKSGNAAALMLQDYQSTNNLIRKIRQEILEESCR